jgi:hypothetical protein
MPTPRAQRLDCGHIDNLDWLDGFTAPPLPDSSPA